MDNVQSILQRRLLLRLPEILAESVEIRKLYPDPVQAVIDLLSGIEGDYAIWREIMDEPYG